MTVTTSIIMPLTRASVTPVTGAGIESVFSGCECFWNLGNAICNRISNLYHNVFNWGRDNDTALNDQTTDTVSLEPNQHNQTTDTISLQNKQYDQRIDIALLENRCQFPLGGLPTDVIQLVFVQCLSSGDIKGFMALGRMNTQSYVMMRKVVNEVALTQLCVSLENKCLFPLGGLPTNVIKRIFAQCLSCGDIKGFMALGRTNTHSYATMRKLVNETALTRLCPNLRILNARTFTFHADLRGIDKYKTLQSYHKLEPFVEDRAGLTIIFNQGGLTLKNMKENNCGTTIRILVDEISKDLDNVPEEDTGPEMISNAPIAKTRSKSFEVQETRVRDEVGFDGKPTLIQYLALVIATQKEFGIWLYAGELNGEETKITCGRTSTQFRSTPLTVGGFASGNLGVRTFLTDSTTDSGARQCIGAGGRLKL